MKLIAATILLFSFAYPPKPQECKCRVAESWTTTHKGYFESTLVEPATQYKRLAGIVYLDDTPVEDVLVELFPYTKQPSAERKRLTACITGADGRYCFAGIAKGRYEIRVSKDGGFEITYVSVYLDPNNRKASDSELGISIKVGK